MPELLTLEAISATYNASPLRSEPGYSDYFGFQRFAGELRQAHADEQQAVADRDFLQYLADSS